jgi:hypothetical protein
MDIALLESCVIATFDLDTVKRKNPAEAGFF